MPKKAIRCAVYTRKSSDEGLDQDFNSLDAQREACAAFVASQKGEGWKLVSGHYDDGGISGGTLERPALQRLLEDVDAGRVGLVVVYKVDRLTRSLADFAKLVERFDAAGASFVSVTQQFNTATSMGRLTLNVLLSFAQFEREVTAERIRDKIAASKRKGMWMGGLPPLGYDAADRTLVVNEAEAKTVRTIFDLYLELGSVREVKEESDRRGLISKRRRFANGTVTGGVPFTRGRLYHLLSNPIYIGEIRHKEKSYPGQHPAIIEQATFIAVQNKLEANRQHTQRRGNYVQPSPLAGKFVDETGDRLTPSHAIRRGKRHRYYVSRRLISNSGSRNTNGWRLPAKTLEGTVASLLVNAVSSHNLVIDAAPEILQKAQVANRDLIIILTGTSRGPVLNQVLDSGRIEPGQISITLSRDAIASRLGVPIGNINANALNLESEFTLRRRGVEARVVLGDTHTNADTVLLNNLAQGFTWFEQVKAGESLKAIADRHGVTRRRISSLIDLSFLAPDIVQAIVDGRQPLSLTANRLAGWRHRPVWADQRAWLSTV